MSNDMDDITSIARSNARHKMPRSILPEYKKMLFGDQNEQTKAIALKLIDANWRFYATDTSRGYCNHNNGIITIPMHAFRKGSGYKTWYICHEMSHALVGHRHNHDAVFMAKLIEICPADCIHYELGYKPRNARSAGISCISNAISSGYKSESDWLKAVKITKEQQQALVKLNVTIKDSDWL